MKAIAGLNHLNLSVSNLEISFDFYTQKLKGDSLYILDPDNYKLELHVGNWQTRLEAVKENPYEDMVFFYI